MRRIFIALSTTLLLSGHCLADDRLNLNESIDAAKINSESISVSRAKLEEAEALSGQAFAALLPTIRLDASYGRSYQTQPPVTVGPPFVPTPTTFSFAAHEMDLFSYSGNLSQNIFAGGRVINGWQMADLGVSAAKEELRLAEIELEYNVVSAYYGVIKANRAYELAKESVDMAGRHLDQTKVMFSSGVVTKAEILRSELEVARAELALSRSESGTSLSHNSFNLAIGRDIDAPVVLDDQDFKLEELTAPKYEEFLTIAYSSRPEWKIVNFGETIADKQKWISYSGYVPAILLNGSYGYNNYKDTVINADSMLNSWSVMLVGSWTLFDGLGTPNKVKEACAKYVEVAKQRDLLKKKIAIEVKDACLSLNSAVSEVKAAKKSMELAEENFKIAELRFSAGVATNLEVIDAKTMLTNANLDFLQSEFNYELAKAQVNKAVGREVLSASRASAPPEGQNEIVLEGVVKYVPIEGGFVGFIDAGGNSYDLLGVKAREISGAVGISEEGSRIKIVGKIKRDVATTHMWGTPFEVTSYEWK